MNIFLLLVTRSLVLCSSWSKQCTFWPHMYVAECLLFATKNDTSQKCSSTAQNEIRMSDVAPIFTYRSFQGELILPIFFAVFSHMANEQHFKLIIEILNKPSFDESSHHTSKRHRDFSFVCTSLELWGSSKPNYLNLNCTTQSLATNMDSCSKSGQILHSTMVQITHYEAKESAKEK